MYTILLLTRWRSGATKTVAFLILPVSDEVEMISTATSTKLYSVSVFSIEDTDKGMNIYVSVKAYNILC